MQSPVGFNILGPQLATARAPASAEQKSEAQSLNDFGSTLEGRVESPLRPVDTKKEQTKNPKNHVQASSFNGGMMVPGPMASPVRMAPTMTISAPIKPEGTIATNDPEAMNNRLAWSDFLRQMKNELDVSASDILSAFQSLTEEDLKLAPEQNIHKMVAQLGLNPQQSMMASQMFMQLIDKTDSKALTNQMKGGGASDMLATMSQRELQKAASQRSLEAMSQSFFRKDLQMTPEQNTHVGLDDKTWLAGGPGAFALPKGMINAEGLSIPNAAMMPKAEFEIPQGMTPVTDGELPAVDAPVESMAMPMSVPMAISVPLNTAQDIAVPMAATANTGQPMPLSVNETIANEPLVQDSMANLTPSQIMNAMDQSVKAPSFKPTSPIAENISMPAEQAGPISMPMPIAVPTIGRPDSSGTPEHGRDDDESADSIGELDEQTAPGTPFVASAEGKLSVDAQVKTETVVPTLAPRELVEQAQVMVTEGGGEMKAILNPEGLGEVAMKVTVHEGKVSVQMITQSDEAKKALESTFNALNDGLKAHNLSLESIKVDTSSNLGKQMDEQYKDAQRQAAHNFMEQFRHDNSGWRRSQFDIPGAEIYRSQSVTRPNGSSTSSSAKKNSSRRLDLVA